MNNQRFFPALFATLLLSSAACAQAPPPLNLKLPPPAAASSAAASPAATPPGTYYGDTSGRISNTDTDFVACDDATRNKAQVHGSVGTGIFSGRHIGSGTFSSGSVSIDKRYGSCDEPAGGVSMSISVGGSRFHGRGD